MLKVLFLILVAMTSIDLAQTQENTEQNNQLKAYIFAELGKANNTEVKNQFEKFYKELKKDSDSQAYIINYGTNKEVAKREKQLRDSISFRHEHDTQRLTFVRGENVGKLKTVFWIVPSGAKPPTP